MKTKVKAPFFDFDARMFCEAFRQLKTIGILALVIMCLAAALLPIGVAVSTPTEYEYMDMTTSYVPTVNRQLVTLVQVHPLSLAPMYTIALLMPLIGFSFLNKRRSSDFYHALPVSRAGVFISYFAAIMAWILVDLVASTAVSAITLSCFPKLFQLVWSSILPTLCISFAGALMTAGCMTFAMCITGTTFTNLLVAALLFFGPRILMWYISALIQNVVNILPDMMNIPILNVSYNIPLSVINDILYNGENVAFGNWIGIAYSAVIGLLYVFGGLAVFRVRRSEAAEQPAATPLLQTVYRLTITFFVSLIPTFLIFSVVNSEKPHLNSEELFIIFVLYLVTALAFSIYELITTKKPKLLLKAAPSFLFVLAADAVLILCLSLSVNDILHFRPTAQQVQSVSFETTESGRDNSEYFSVLTAGVKITDKDTIRAVTEQLAYCAKENTAYGEDYDHTQAHHSFNVTIRTKYGQRTRRLVFCGENMQQITNSLQANGNYQTAYQLPFTKEMQVSAWSLDDAQAKDVYTIMAKEFAKLPFEERYSLSEGSFPGGADQTIVDNLQISVSRRGKIYQLRFPLIAEYYPEAYEKYLQYVYENQATERKEILKILPQVFQKDYELSIEILTNDGVGTYRGFAVDTGDLTDYGKWLVANAWVPRVQDVPFSADNWLVRITVNAPKTDVSFDELQYYTYHEAYFPFPRDFVTSEAFDDFEQEVEKAHDVENEKYEALNKY